MSIDLTNILPPNEKKKPKETPRNFVIFGGTMEGKTYFSEEFPNPLNLNTDGNADMIETPSINIRNERGKDGKIVKPASRSEEHTSELQSRGHLVCRLLLEK